MKKIFMSVVLCSFLATAALATQGAPGGAKQNNKSSPGTKKIELIQVQYLLNK